MLSYRAYTCKFPPEVAVPEVAVAVAAAAPPAAVAVAASIVAAAAVVVAAAAAAVDTVFWAASATAVLAPVPPIVLPAEVGELYVATSGRKKAPWSETSATAAKLV